MSLSNINNLLLESIKTTLTEDKINVDTNDIDFAELFNVADKHSVNMLCFDGIKDKINLISQDVYYNWVYYASRKMTINEKVLSVQKKLTNILEDSNIKYFIFKGLAIASYYKKYELRELGDIDFYIDYSDFKKANKLLKSNGFELVSTNSTSHWHYICDGIDVEMHYNFWKMPKNNCSNYINDILHNSLSDTKKVCINDYYFETPNNICNALILILHIINHIQTGGIGLRHICDFCVFYSSEEFKNNYDEIMCAFKKGGVFKVAQIVAKISQLHLGGSLYEFTNNVDDELVNEFLNDILNSGNFGSLSQESYYGSAVFTMNKSGDSNIFKSMFSFCKLAWPFCEKHKILLPVAPVYIGIRYVFRTVLGKRPKINPLKFASSGLKRANLYEQLKFFEEE